ncbi:CatB-related O-acetyltransferase [Mesorhizobium sp. B2-1-3A]|uniref:CatB-related O-acetyltransferase n=1 Tax=Mesorhizobium sp. B2-1-3A TaxID=2589971 RepID=UPI001129AE2A|nr:CatB-related O-acetyltransferase [Mesorhizobium sp. B2-1-3A]TPM89870.1 CatB-related O-acetyltransferase [Mesorhizobium sp. B2-1-3A]
MSKLTIWFRNRQNPVPKDTKLGRWTYGIDNGLKIFGCNPNARLEIGSFCSIAADVVFLCSGNHPTACATTSFIQANMLGKPAHKDPSGRRGITIGNDVWIGRRSMILPGVKIGHGGVVAAQTTVTKDVPPYTIVGGNPAKKIRLRFPEEIVEKMLAIRWWDWDDEKIKQEADLLTGPIEDFVAKHG